MIVPMQHCILDAHAQLSKLRPQSMHHLFASHYQIVCCENSGIVIKRINIDTLNSIPRFGRQSVTAIARSQNNAFETPSIAKSADVVLDHLCYPSTFKMTVKNNNNHKQITPAKAASKTQLHHRTTD
jgi:hypothetical protein